MMDDNKDVISAESLLGLPAPVQRYLAYTGVVGRPRIKTAWVKWSGRFRRAIDQPWMPMTAEQFYSVNPPGFVWNARFQVAGLPLMRARDTYKDGQGHMYARLAWIIPIFDLRSEELIQGTMVRYLQEMAFFPTAYLEPYVEWKPVDDTSAEVIFTDHGKSVSGKMYFDPQGRLLDFKAQRYREINGDFSLDTWTAPINSYGTIAGLNLPKRGMAVWKLASGDLPYAEVEAVEVRYNLDEA
jgi:hypothetical protein